MLNLVLPMLLVPALVGTEPAIQAGTLLTYRGTIERRTDDAGGKSRKSFDLSIWVARSDGDGAEVSWMVDERGRGEWPWFERAGRLTLDAHLQSHQSGPVLLYDRGAGRSVVAVPLPFLKPDQELAADVTWKDQKLNYHVDKADKVADRDVWQITLRDEYGPKRLFYLDKNSPLVVSGAEKVMLGQGEEYQLKWELLGSEQLDQEEAPKLSAAFDAFIALRGKLNLPAQSQEVEWKAEQIALLTAQVPELQKKLAGTALEKVAAAAKRDIDLQADRHSAVSDHASKYMGHEVQKFSVSGLGADTLSADDLKGNVTVLHFWEYRNEPLKEPYGQVGYLDFLYQRRKGEGLRVYGVAVDGRLADEKTRSAAQQSVKKFKEFMNLSYPVLLDGGPLVKQFGDPRPLGATLPLFVVVGPDGKIVHYHVGHHKVHQEQGLSELDRVVGEALKKK